MCIIAQDPVHCIFTPCGLGSMHAICACILKRREWLGDLVTREAGTYTTWNLHAIKFDDMASRLVRFGSLTSCCCLVIKDDDVEA